MSTYAIPKAMGIAMPLLEAGFSHNCGFVFDPGAHLESEVVAAALRLHILLGIREPKVGVVALFTSRSTITGILGPRA